MLPTLPTQRAARTRDLPPTLLTLLALLAFAPLPAALADDDPQPKTCDEGNTRDCFNQAFDIQQKDPKAALALSERGCDLGDGTCCQFVAGMYLMDKGIPKDVAQARRFYGKACDLGDAFACSRLANGYCDGNLGEKDPVKCVSLLEPHCTELDDTQCARLASIYLEGQVVPKDAAKAANYFKIGCGFEGRNCYNLAVMYSKGDGVPQDMDKFKEYMKLACENGVEQACKHAQ